MIDVLSVAALLLALSTVCGAGICAAAGYPRQTMVAPAVGFAALLVVAGSTVRTGGTTPALIGVAVLLVACGYCLVRSRSVRLLPLWAGLMMPAVVLVSMLPFWVSGRFGLLGVGTNDDLVEHLLASWTLQRGVSSHSNKLIASGYPIGPHSIVAAIATLTGIPLPQAFMGLLVVVPAILAVTAGTLLRAGPTLLRAAIASAVGLCYLQAAYLVQASFKETIEATIFVAVGGGLYELQRRARPTRLCALGLAVLAAGSAYDYSYPGLLWPGVTVAIWWLLHLVSSHPVRANPIAYARRYGPSLVVGTGVFLALVSPEVSRMLRFSRSGYNHELERALGDLLHPLPPQEALGIWPRLDFRFSVPMWSIGGVLAVVALGGLIVCLVRAVRRKDLVVPALVLAGAGVYCLTDIHSSPYTAAKALTILAPTITLLLGREMLLSLRSRPRLWSRSAVLPTIVALTLLAGAYSDFEVLRDGPVGPSSHARQLASLQPIIRHRPTLFLGLDDFVQWELRFADISTPPNVIYPMAVVPIRQTKTGQRPSAQASLDDAVTLDPKSGRGLFDFDSVPSNELNRFTFVILARSAYTSQPPPNWHLVRTLASYELWQRIGPTPPHRTLAEGGNPGAVLNCRTAADRMIAARRGTAMVRPRPVVGKRRSWRGAVGYAGMSARELVPLHAGYWNVSLQYDSIVPLALSGPGSTTSLPANLDGVGPYFYVGRIHVVHAGPVRIVVASDSLPWLGRLLGAYGFTRAPRPTGLRALGRIAFTRPTADRPLPLSRACGRYVDWYTLDPIANGRPRRHDGVVGR